MPLEIWRRPGFAAVVVIGFCLFAAWVGANFMLSLTLQQVLGYSPTAAAAALLPLAIGGLISATLAGRLLPRTGARPLLIVGLAVYVGGFALMAVIGVGSGYWPHVLAAVVLAVVGNSVTFVASNVVALAHAGPHEHSLVGGLFNTGMQVGGGLGLAVMSVVAASQIRGDASGAALLPGYQAAFWTAAGIAGLGLVIAVLFVRTATSGRSQAAGSASSISARASSVSGTSAARSRTRRCARQNP